MNDKPTMTGISLTEVERDIVAMESQRRGLNNFSATLRMIIREWADSQRQALPRVAEPEKADATSGIREIPTL